MLQNQRRLACALLLGLCAGATAVASAQSCDARVVLESKLSISTGGPYEAKAGTPITLHGTYAVDGQSVNTDHLKAIGQALDEFAHVHGYYPPEALLNLKGQKTVSWRVLILPYLGYQKLFDRFNLSKPWNDPVNLPLLKEMPGVYRKLGAAEGTTETGFAGLTGTGAFFQDSTTLFTGGRKLNEVTATEKIVAGPVGADVHLPWSAPGDIQLSKLPLLGSSHGFSGQGCAITPLLFANGSVYLIPDKTAAGPLVTWSLFPNKPAENRCPCAPPASVDVGLHALWDLGENGTSNTQGWNVQFLAKQPGSYTVTVHATDHFGSDFKRSTTVHVH